MEICNVCVRYIYYNFALLGTYVQIMYAI